VARAVQGEVQPLADRRRPADADRVALGEAVHLLLLQGKNLCVFINERLKLCLTRILFWLSTWLIEFQFQSPKINPYSNMCCAYFGLLRGCLLTQFIGKGGAVAIPQDFSATMKEFAAKILYGHVPDEPEINSYAHKAARATPIWYRYEAQNGKWYWTPDKVRQLELSLIEVLNLSIKVDRFFLLVLVPVLLKFHQIIRLYCI
jgi:hypothetical protein